jgi:hypothetical protein
MRCLPRLVTSHVFGTNQGLDRLEYSGCHMHAVFSCKYNHNVIIIPVANSTTVTDRRTGTVSAWGGVGILAHQS